MTWLYEEDDMTLAHRPTASHVRVALAVTVCGLTSAVAVAHALYDMVR